MRERICDLVSGVPADDGVEVLESHLLKCRFCRDYAEALRKEDELLRRYFAEMASSMTGREEEAIRRINDLKVCEEAGLVCRVRCIVESSLAKHVATAAVIAVVALYFIITLSWVSEINELYELSM
jgi:predicted anti-sigma-YlaC factor YlaD